MASPLKNAFVAFIVGICIHFLKEEAITQVIHAIALGIRVACFKMPAVIVQRSILTRGLV